MKRKLNEEDVPMPVEGQAPAKPVRQPPATFESLGLDSKPTQVQAQVIPLALEGKDVLARARTGSGKTAAYVLPCIESILQQKISKPKEKATRVLLLVPTKELAQQVSKVASSFCSFCAKDVRTLNLTQKVSEAVQTSLLADFPEIVVATPARAWIHIRSGALKLESLVHLVIDEADLVLSYGYEDELKSIAKSMPEGIQTMLMSATLSTEVETLKLDYCKDPAVVALDEKEDDKNKVSQFVVKCGEDEKFLFLYVIVKLNLIKGKMILFVQDIDRCYRLKLYLEQFGVRSCVLNSELPVNSRIHVVEEFNKGIYDIIIASDEHEVTGDGSRRVVPDEKEGDEATGGLDDTVDEQAETEPKQKKRKTTKKDKEYGISRGIDFKNVACVINFDLPLSSKSYTHRIGRTARGGKSGMALSFVVLRKQYRKHKVLSVESTKRDEQTLASIVKHQGKKGAEVKDYAFDMDAVDGFRYRTSDALRAVTSIAIREARTRELRNELIKSEKLKRHFEENPDDLRHLRHDGESRAVRVQPHLKHVPDYLMPNGGPKAIAGDLGFVSLRKDEKDKNRIRRNRAINKAKGRGRIAKGKRSDPLKTFNARNRGKK